MYRYVSTLCTYPTTGQGLQALHVQPRDLAEPAKWRGPYVRIANIPPDGWSNPFVYRRLNHDQFELYSSGPDGKDGTEDDVGRGIRNARASKVD